MPAVLPGYLRRKVRFRDYPGVTPAAAPACVRGTYVHGLTDKDMWRLGIFEGSEYDLRRVKVRLLLTVDNIGAAAAVPGSRAAEREEFELLEIEENDAEQGEEVEAQTYVYTAGDYRLEEGEWDFAEFKRNKLRRWTGENDEDEEFEGK